MAKMIPHQLAPHGSQRLVGRRDLRQDIGAVTILLDHLLQPAHLPFDTPQSGEIAHLACGVNREGLS